MVYNAAVPASVAEAAEFVGLLEGKAGTSLENVTAEGKARAVGWGMPDYSAGITYTNNTNVIAPCDCAVIGWARHTNSGSWGEITITVDGVAIWPTRGGTSAAGFAIPFSFPVSKGSTFKVYATATGDFSFAYYPLKGV